MSLRVRVKASAATEKNEASRCTQVVSSVLRKPHWPVRCLALTLPPVCRNTGSRWALEQAKYNLINEYLLVGVTEELEDFVLILEAALPRFFKGATELYKTGEEPPHFNSPPPVNLADLTLLNFSARQGRSPT